MKPLRSLLILAFALSPLTVSAAELSQYVAGKVQHAQQLEQQDKLAQAITLLEKLEPGRSYEQAFVARMLGVYYWQAGESKRALTQLNRAVSAGVLTDQYAWQTERMLADLYLNDQQYQPALNHYYALLKSAPEAEQKSELWLRITQAHFQLKQWPEVVKAADDFHHSGAAWTSQVLSLKLAAQLEQKKLSNAVKTLDQLLLIEPDKLAWWQQQAGLCMQLGKQKKALTVLALAQRQGVALTRDNQRTLAQLYASQGMPERAARQMEKVLSGNDLTENKEAQYLTEQARYWQAAKEWQHAITTWQKAAKLKPAHRWPLAQLLLQEGEPAQALNELKVISNPTADQQLAMTLAYHKLGQPQAALRHAQQAYQQQPSDNALAWINYLKGLVK